MNDRNAQDHPPEPMVPVSALRHARLSTRLRSQQADGVIKEHVIGALGLGLFPVPVLDVVGISVIQLRMLRGLCGLYGVPYSLQLARVAVGLVLGALLPVKATVLVASLLKLIPGFGSLIAGSTSSVTAGAIVYASGRIFVTHFEQGGNLVDFDIAQVSPDLREQFVEGLRVVPALKRRDPGATPED